MYHKVLLAGNLGRDPEMRYTPSGTPVTNLNVATNEAWTDSSGQRQERTIWWRVSVFGKQAEACNEYLKKGRQVLVEGRINADPKTGGPRVYQRQDGSSGASFEVTAINVRFLGGRPEAGPGGATDLESGEPPTEESEIPF